MLRLALPTLLAVFAFAAGCARVAPTAAPSDATPRLVGPEWRLVRLDVPGAPAQRPGPDERYRFTFGAERVDGQVHCNGYAAGYTAADGRLALGPANTTAATCVPPSMAGEVMAALAVATAYTADADTLRLSAPDGRRLVFASRAPLPDARADAAAVAGTPESVWDAARRRGIVFRAVGHQPRWVAEVFSDRRMRVTFGADEPAEFLRPRINRVGGHSVYLGEDETRFVRLTVTDDPCTAAVDGEAFDVAVTVEAGGETLSGCGRVVR